MLQDQRDLKGERKPYKTILKVTFVFLLAIFLWKVFVSVATNPGPLPELPGLIDLQKAENYEQADKALQDADFLPLQDKQNPIPQITMRMFQPKVTEIFGQTPAYCMLLSIQDTEPGPVTTAYYFREPAGGTFENPGEVFTAIRDGLKKSLKKEPEETVQDGLPALLWPLNKNVAAVLSYAGDGAPGLMYIFAR